MAERKLMSDVLRTLYRWTNRRSVRWAAAVGLLIAVVCLASPPVSTFRFHSVCVQCGTLKATTAWQVSGSRMTLYSQSTESESALSRVLREAGLVQPHEHRWDFTSGRGNGIRCALGYGRYFARAARSDTFADMVAMLHDRGEFTFRDRILSVSRRQDELHIAYEDLVLYPVDDSMDSAELQTWIDEQSAQIDFWERVAAAQAQRDRGGAPVKSAVNVLY